MTRTKVSRPMTARINHHMSFMAFCMNSFDFCLALFWAEDEDEDPSPPEVVELDEPPPWPEPEAMDMAEEMTALAMAVAVEAPRPPVRDAPAATVDDMSKVKWDGGCRKPASLKNR